MFGGMGGEVGRADAYIKEKYITLESSLVDDLGADDMDNLEVMMALEEDFEIEIPEDDADGFVTVQDVLDYLIKEQG